MQFTTSKAFARACALTSLTMAFACQNSPKSASQVKIVGGRAVSSADPIVQSTVALEISTDQGTALCTGSLIDPRHIVSAGHCLAEGAQQVTVNFGSSMTRETDMQRGVQTFAVDQNYGLGNAESLNADGSMAAPSSPPSDISLITLADDAPDGFGAVAMLSTGDALAPGETVTLAGFGQTNIDDQSPNHILRKVDTKLVKASATSEEIEVGNTPGRGACHGDSGGPAFVKRGGQLYLVGVTSRDANSNGRCEGNTIYTDVRYYQDWIAATENQ